MSRVSDYVSLPFLIKSNRMIAGEELVNKMFKVDKKRDDYL